MKPKLGGCFRTPSRFGRELSWMHGVILSSAGRKRTWRRQVWRQAVSETSAELLPVLLFTRPHHRLAVLWWCSTSELFSQNPSMAGVGRNLCGSSSPTPCQSRVTYSKLHRSLSRRVLNISREGDSTASLGSLGQGSVTLRGKKFFLGFSWSFLCSSLCPNSVVRISKASRAWRGSTRHAQPALAYYVSSCFAGSLGQAVW